MTIRAPLGWATASNARHEVKLRDYLDKLRGDIGSELEGLITTGKCDEYYALGAAVLEMRSVKSLIDFAADKLRGDGEKPTKENNDVSK